MEKIYISEARLQHWQTMASVKEKSLEKSLKVLSISKKLPNDWVL